MKSTFNPIYMGSDFDYKGDRVEVVTTPTGQKANKVTVEHHKQFVPKCHKVCDGVYQSVGYGMSNVCMIEGKTGMIIVDSNNCNEAAELNLLHFREISKKPVSAIIYSHYHYCNGTERFLKEAVSSDVEIWAHEDYLKNMLDLYTDLFPLAYRRNIINNGMVVPPDGELGHVDSGLGGVYVYPGLTGMTIGWVAPNKFIPDIKMTEAVIDGVKFEFYPANSECSDSIITYLPEKRCALTNHAWPVMANLYTLRGELGRDPKNWIYAIDLLRELKVEHLGGCHGVPISGCDEVNGLMTHYRDFIQYLYDRTIKGMNDGKDVDEILCDIEVPGYFSNGRLTKETYGEVEYCVKGIYRTFIGWFGHDPVELHPVTKDYEANRIVKGFGGKTITTLKTVLAYKRKEYSWAAQLATYVLRVDPNNKLAKKLKMGSFMEMAFLTPSAHTRSWYTAAILSLNGDFEAFKNRIRPTREYVGTFNARYLIKSMPINLIANKCSNIKKTVEIKITDTGETCGFYMRPFVAEYSENILNPDVILSTNTSNIIALVSGEKTYDELIKGGAISIEGDIAFGKEIGQLFDF